MQRWIQKDQDGELFLIEDDSREQQLERWCSFFMWYSLALSSFIGLVGLWAVGSQYYGLALIATAVVLASFLSGWLYTNYLED